MSEGRAARTRWLPCKVIKVSKTWPDAIPLARAFGQETRRDHTVIWVNQHGRGRVFAITPGHGIATLESPSLPGLVTRGLLWTCDQQTAEGTPQPGYAVPSPSKIPSQ
jgi:type 1 glutamine amidotransferase